MDDGTKITELMFKASIATKMALLKLVIFLLKTVYNHLKWMQEHNIKSGLRKLIDKAQGKCIKQMAKVIEKNRDLQKEKIIFEQRKLDKFTLSKKYELENYKVEVLKAQKAYDIAKEKNINSKELAKLQNNINFAKDNQRLFEYETSKEYMALSHKIDDYKYNLEQIECDLKICNQKLKAVYSPTKIYNESLNNDFENLSNNFIERYKKILNNDKIEYKSKSNDKDTFKNNMDNLKDIDNNYEKESFLINQENIDNNGGKYDNIKNDYSISVDNNGKTSNKDDKVIKMFERDPESLKILEQSKKDTSSNLLNNHELNTDIKL